MLLVFSVDFLAIGSEACGVMSDDSQSLIGLNIIYAELDEFQAGEAESR